MVTSPKLPAKKKARSPKALGSIARQQLLLIDGLLDEVARNYIARLHRETAGLIRALEQRQAGPGFSEKQVKDLREMLRRIADLHVDVERGRRKDLKKIDALIGELQSVTEKW
jgi:hypothetical protein